MKKNIWIFNHYISHYDKGESMRHRFFCKELKKAGYNVSLFYASQNDTNNMDIKQYQLHSFEKENNIVIPTRKYVGNGLSRVLNMLDYSRGIKKNFKKIAKQIGEPDVIYASSVHPFACEVGLKVAKHFKIKCICEIRDLWPLSIVEYTGASKLHPFVLYLGMLEKKIYKKADRLIFTMEGGKQYITDKKWDKQIDLSKVHHINNGVDLEAFEKNAQENKIEDSDLDSDKFKVVYCGSIRSVNNLKLLVDCAEILKDNKEIDFLVYGDGDQREALEKYCQDHNLTNIKFKGWVAKKYVPYILSQSSANIINVEQTELTKKYGCSLNKLFDYLASGKPIVSNLVVAHDLIQRFSCGIVTESQSSDEFAKAILAIKNMPKEEQLQMGQRAKEVAKEYDFKVLTQKLAEIIESL